MNAEDIECLTAFFEYVDVDKSGYLTMEEIRAACRVDRNSDGVIDNVEEEASARPWLEAFAQQDKDDDERVSLQELIEYNT